MASPAWLTDASAHLAQVPASTPAAQDQRSHLLDNLQVCLPDTHTLWALEALQSPAVTWHKHLGQCRESNVLMEAFTVQASVQYIWPAAASALSHPL